MATTKNTKATKVTATPAVAVDTAPTAAPAPAVATIDAVVRIGDRKGLPAAAFKLQIVPTLARTPDGALDWATMRAQVAAVLGDAVAAQARQHTPNRPDAFGGYAPAFLAFRYSSDADAVAATGGKVDKGAPNGAGAHAAMVAAGIATADDAHKVHTLRLAAQ